MHQSFSIVVKKIVKGQGVLEQISFVINEALLYDENSLKEKKCRYSKTGGNWIFAPKKY